MRTTDTPCQQDLSTRELVALAERHDAAACQHGLDAARAEAERRADDQPADSLAAQVAGYLSLLAEDTEHALADEAQAWSLELRRALAPDALTLPAPRAHADRALHS